MENKTLLTVQEILKATNGTLFNNEVDNGISFFSVVIDSRDVVENSLFVALVGTEQDGHSYIEQAVKKGATIVLAQKDSLPVYEQTYCELCHKAIIVLVKNTLRALQHIAKSYVHKFPHLIRIAITGSNGKTTAKECIASVLSKKYSVAMNVGNLNSETGLPLSMFSINETHEIGVFEMGMNRRGEIKELADVFFPNIALITNIGTAHIGILGTQMAIAEEKKQIFSNFTNDNVGFVYEDDTYYDFLLSNVSGAIHPYGIQSFNSLVSTKSNGLKGSVITLENTSIDFALIGKHNLQNAFAAIAIAQHLGLSHDQIKEGLESVKPLFGRSEVLEGDITIIQDCYNGSYESMSSSIDFFDELEWRAKKIIIVGDMLELGDKSIEIHSATVKKILSLNFDICVFFGSSFKEILKTTSADKKNTVLFTNDISDDGIAKAIDRLSKHIHKGDIVLLKASRGIKLERCASALQKLFSKKEERQL